MGPRKGGGFGTQIKSEKKNRRQTNMWVYWGAHRSIMESHGELMGLFGVPKSKGSII